MAIDDYIYASNQAVNLCDLFTVYEKAMANIGFDRLVFSFLTDHLELQEEARHGVVRNYPDDWFSYYAEKDYFEVDPVRHLAEHSHAAFTWAYVESRAVLTKDQRDIMNGGREAGLLDGIGIPLRSHCQAIAGVGAASSTGGINLDQHTLSVASVLSYQFYVRYLALAKKNNISTIDFTKREIEVLKWSSKGYTKCRLADKLKLSRHTVDYHVRNILRKTDSPNITAAVVFAIHHGYIVL